VWVTAVGALEHEDEVYPELHMTSMQQFTCVAVAVLYFSSIRRKVCLVCEMLQTKLLMTWALYLYPSLKHVIYGAVSSLLSR
jgi:hypothetical protein